MIVVLVVGAVMLCIAAVLVVVRMTQGPTVLDRIIAFDVLVSVAICTIGLEAAVHQNATPLPILVALSLLGFVGSATVAAFSRGSQVSDEEDS